MNKPILACDIDGCIADCDGPLCHHLGQQGYHYTLDEQSHYYWVTDMLTERYGIEDPLSVLNNIWWDEEFILNQPLILPMLGTLRKIRGMANRLHMVTARDPRNRPWVKTTTRSWLDRYGVPYDTLAFETDKAEYCRLHGIDYIIEDSASTAEKCLDIGVGVFLIDRTYNRSLQPQGGLWRITNPLEIPDLLAADLARNQPA